MALAAAERSKRAPARGGTHPQKSPSGFPRPEEGLTSLIDKELLVLSAYVERVERQKMEPVHAPGRICGLRDRQIGRED